ncbi:MAG: DMT family transporter [Nitrincola lacisaponensis]|uniref:Permease of the drug/metabolite transporter (DMT) superfamily n=1 Tax=Nitrincola lacisaponensis TaxID=267850 RepID=A0A063Y1D7_9GAMM|nr:DMT family transporter [Nitrincola lacisaponensis]KDE39469.1 Permease of the drug/metabolite transporter (DMT) superfamily [Nitrincola lacisaponensis]
MSNNSIRSDLMLVAVTLLAATSWVFSREALTGMAPLQFIGGRFFCAGLVLGVFGYSALKRLAGEAWLRALMTGVIMGIAMCLWIMGLYHSDNMGIGAFITSLSVVFVPIVGRFFFATRTALSTWIAMLIALLGLACLRIEGGFSLSASDLFFLASAVMLSIHFNLNSRYAARIPPLPLTAIQLCVTGLVALSLSALTEAQAITLNASLLGWLLASIVIGTCMRFFLQVKAQGMAPASHAAVIMTLEPVWASLIGILIYAERMTSIQLLGCILIFSALLVSRWRFLLRRPG